MRFSATCLHYILINVRACMCSAGAILSLIIAPLSMAGTWICTDPQGNKVYTDHSGPGCTEFLPTSPPNIIQRPPSAKAPSVSKNKPIPAPRSFRSVQPPLEENKVGVTAEIQTNSRSESEFILAVARGNTSKVRMLLEAGISANLRTIEGRSVVAMAAEQANMDTIELLIAHGADVNARSHRGETALSAAVHARRKDIVKFLLDKGADINAIAPVSVNPPMELPILSIAISQGDPNITRLLIERGASVNSRSNQGVTPLMVSILTGQKEIVKQLLDKGADSNALVPLDIGTPQHMPILFTAILKGDIEIVKLLVEKGADVNVKSASQHQTLSPLEFALKSGKQDIARVLMSKGTADTPETSPVLKANLNLDDHIKVLETRLATLCRDAGETIVKTVDNVEGIYIQPQQDAQNDNYYHEREFDPSMYVMPTLGRHYRYVEIGFHHTNRGIEHRPPIPPPGETHAKGAYTNLTEPQASYGFTWKALTTKQEQLQGLHGDELTVFHIKTQEVLATRRIFFYVIKSGIVSATGSSIAVPQGVSKFVMCKNYSLPEEESFTDRRPRASYKFVSRVLRPRVMPGTQAPQVFDLARGSGHKVGSCSHIGFGPNIKPADLRLSRGELLDLQISIANTDDMLRCKHWLSADGFKNREVDRLFIFYDGSRLRFAELLDRLPQSATARLYSLATGSGTTRSETCFAATAGPNVTPNDLVLSQVTNDLHVAIQGTNDVLICAHFFQRLKNFSENTQLTFYDGQTMNLLQAFRYPSTYLGSASDSELHVIGIYEGTPAGDHDSEAWWFKCPQPATSECHRTYTSRRTPKQVKVHVSYQAKPVILALVATEATQWLVDAADGVVIERVILAGYGAQQVEGIRDGIPTDIYTHDPSPCTSCRQDRRYFYDYRRSHPRLGEITGRKPSSFQGRYTGIDFVIPPPPNGQK